MMNRTKNLAVSLFLTTVVNVNPTQSRIFTIKATNWGLSETGRYPEDATGEPIVGSLWMADGIAAHPMGSLRFERWTSNETQALLRWVNLQDWVLGLHEVFDVTKPDLVLLEPFADRIIEFLKLFGDIEGKGLQLDEPRDASLSVLALATRIAELRLALGASLAIASCDQRLTDGAIGRWNDFAAGWKTPSLFGFPVYNQENIRNLLADRSLSAGLKVSWEQAEPGTPRVAVPRPTNPFAAVMLSLAVTAGAVSAPYGIEGVHRCAECGLLFVAERKRLRGDSKRVYCTERCSNRFFARKHRQAKKEELS
jgi:hypothetical protein